MIFTLSQLYFKHA